MRDIGIDLRFRDNEVVKGWQEQINLTRQLVGNIERVQREMNQTSTRMGSNLTNVQRQTAQTNKSLGGMFGAIKGAAVIYALQKVGSAVASVGKATVTAAGEYEQLNIAFTTMLGSADRAKFLLEDLSKFAKETPFGSDEINKTAKTMVAFGFETSTLIDQMTMLGDVSAGTGKNFNELAVIYGQVKLAGRLMGQDLLQFTNAGIPLVAELAKNFEVSESAIKGMVSAGEIGFSDVEAAMASMTSEGGQFSGLMKAQSESLLGYVEQIKDGFEILSREVGEEFLPVVKAIAERVGEFMDSLDTGQLLAYFAPLRETLLPALKELVMALGRVISSITGLSDTASAGEVLNKLFNGLVNVVTILAKAITAVVDAINWLVNDPYIQGFLGELQAGFRDLGRAIEWVSEKLGGSAQAAQADALSKAALKKQMEELHSVLGRSVVDAIDKFTKKTAVSTELTKADEAAIKKRAQALKALGAAYEQLQRKLEQSDLAFLQGPERIARETELQLAEIDRYQKELEAKAKEAGQRLNSVTLTALDALRENIKRTGKIELEEYEKELQEASIARRQAQDKEDLATYEYYKSQSREILDARIAMSEAVAERLEVVERQALEDKFTAEKTAIERQEVERAELELRLHRERIARYIAQQEELARHTGIAYAPESDTTLYGLRTQEVALTYKVDETKTKEGASKQFKSIDEWMNSNLMQVFGIDSDTARMIQDSYSQLFGTIVKGWQETTAAQIEANEALQESLQERRQNAQKELELEIEAAKLGYANNIEAKQAELETIAKEQKRAASESLRLKKKQATQELIMAEIQAGASMVESVAKAFSANAGIPFGVGVAIAAAQIASMFGIFLSYKSKVKALSQSQTALYKGGRPVDFLQPGESPKRDAPGRGSGHQIDGTNLVMGAYEMIMNEQATNANLPFLRAMNKGDFNNVDLMTWAKLMSGVLDPSTMAMPNMRKTGRKLGKIADAKEAAQINLKVNQAIERQTASLISYFEHKPTRLSHNGSLIEYRGKNKKIIKQHEV